MLPFKDKTWFEKILWFLNHSTFQADPSSVLLILSKLISPRIIIGLILGDNSPKWKLKLYKRQGLALHQFR